MKIRPSMVPSLPVARPVGGPVAGRVSCRLTGPVAGGVAGPVARAVAGLIAGMVPGQAFAHGGHGNLTAAWTFDPWIVIPLLLSGGLYALGTVRLWRHAGVGRGIRPWQAGCYGAGWLLLAGALVSPLHGMGEHLFTAHMVEHEIIMACAAPLLALARPVGAFLWAFPAASRRRLGRAGRQRHIRAAWTALTSPLPATIWHGAVIWFWHAPLMFDAAVGSILVHRLQHVTFLVSALAFWWALVRRCDRGSAVFHLFATMIHTTLLGALMAMAPHVLYVRQTVDSLRWGLTPLEDQQLAGLVMWVPAGTVYAGAALACAALWIRQSSVGWRHVDAHHQG
jgi:cytochrome c oxidase assembly factor CtaG